jgi:hypothetical protein
MNYSIFVSLQKILFFTKSKIITVEKAEDINQMINVHIISNGRNIQQLLPDKLQ